MRTLSQLILPGEPKDGSAGTHWVIANSETDDLNVACRGANCTFLNGTDNDALIAHMEPQAWQLPRDMQRLRSFAWQAWELHCAREATKDLQRKLDEMHQQLADARAEVKALAGAAAAALEDLTPPRGQDPWPTVALLRRALASCRPQI